MKWIRVLVVMLVVGLFWGSSVFAKKYVLKAVTAWPKPVTDNQAFFIFADIVKKKVAEKYPGQLEIRYLGGPEVIKHTEQVHGLQTGLVDMCFTTNAYYVSLLPEVDALKLSDFMPWEERERGAWEFLNWLHESRIGVHYLARLGLGIKFNLYLLKPIKKADLTGLNVRVSPMYLQIIKALGGNPVVIPPTEVYTALQRGVVDGYCWPSIGIMDWGWHRLTKYVVEPGFYQVPNPLLVGLKAWKRLPEHLRALLTEAAVEAEREAVKYFQELAKEERPKLIGAGIKVIELPPAERDRFLRVGYEAAWKEIMQRCSETGPRLRKLLSK
ncbi:MAG: hypothetical protein DRG31_00715 [Deltaproteobacteria bacterium]|nr:MAG: hypothetical protein DRG31_00715 [Deltaproteobacteria bacterium]